MDAARRDTRARHLRRARRLWRDGTAVMLGGTLAATVLAYLFQLLGTRVLGAEAFAPISVLWTVQFLVTTVVMVPIEQLVIRRMVLTKGLFAGLQAPSVLVLLGLAVVAAWVSAMVAPGFGHGISWALLAVLLVMTYVVFAAARGVTAGRRQYRRYGGATAAEALVRVLLGGAVLVITQDPLALGVVMVLAPLGVLLVSPFAAVVADRAAFWARADAANGARTDAASFDSALPLVEEPSVEVVVGSAGRFLLPLVVANGACQTLLGIGPLVVAGLGAAPAVLTSVFLTFTLFRGPLWVIQSALARVLPPFTKAAEDRGALRTRAAELAGAGIALGLVALPVGWWLGPWVVGLLFGADVAPAPEVAGLLACGTAVSGVTLFVGQLLVARGRTTPLALAWCLALAAAAALLLLPVADPSLLVALAFCGGEIVALVATSAYALFLSRSPATR